MTKYTIDSFIEDPLPFRAYTKVSNFTALNKVEIDGEGEEKPIEQISALADIKVPYSLDLSMLKLPKLSSIDLQSLHNDILTLGDPNQDKEFILTEECTLT